MFLIFSTFTPSFQTMLQFSFQEICYDAEKRGLPIKWEYLSPGNYGAAEYLVHIFKKFYEEIKSSTSRIPPPVSMYTFGFRLYT